MWLFYLEKHFRGNVWKKYYKAIIFYIFCVNSGLKPCFMWDLGPPVVLPQDLHCFLTDLKNSGLISGEIVVISVHCNIFVCNVSRLLAALEENKLIVDITKNEMEWSLHNTNEFLTYAKNYIKQCLIDPPSDAHILFKMQHEDFCWPTVFGLLLGFPLLYYFKLHYQTFSVGLKLFQINCEFDFFNAGEKYIISRFSIPNNLYNENVKEIVNEWFNHLNNIDNAVFKHLKMECNNKYVNSLIL